MGKEIQKGNGQDTPKTEPTAAFSSIALREICKT